MNYSRVGLSLAQGIKKLLRFTGLPKKIRSNQLCENLNPRQHGDLPPFIVPLSGLEFGYRLGDPPLVKRAYFTM